MIYRRKIGKWDVRRNSSLCFSPKPTSPLWRSSCTLLQTRCYYHMPAPLNFRFRGIDFLANKSPWKLSTPYTLHQIFRSPFNAEAPWGHRYNSWNALLGARHVPFSLMIQKEERNEKRFPVAFDLAHSHRSLAYDKTLCCFISFENDFCT